MRKIMMLFVFSLVFVLSACNTNKDNEPVADATLTGVTDVTVNLDATFDQMSGVSAKDHDDTDLTDSITVEGTVDTTEPGEYTLTYKVTGESDNEVTATRKVTVVTEAPVITADPTVITITEGDDLDLLLGVTATDDYDTDITVTVSDDDDFDKTVPGTYTITYTATDSNGNTSTITRQVIVEEIVLSYLVEVQQELDSKWGSKVLTVAGENFIRATADYDLGDPQNITIVYNESDAAIVVNSTDVYGQVAVIDKHGVVIEGRDGTNGKLVNEANPIRTSGAQLDPTTYAASVNVPAGGFLLMAPNTAGGAYDSDGRAFVAKNVIYKFENVVSIYLEDNSEIVTDYINRAPVIEKVNKIEVVVGSTIEDLDAFVKAGITVIDDNGTFDPADDIEMTLADVLVQPDPNFDIDVVGTYTFILGVVDSAGKQRTVQRIVEVLPSTPTEPTIEIGTARYAIDTDLINPSAISINNINIFTPEYTGDLKTLTVKWGIIVQLNGNGEIILVRDGVNNKEFNLENPNGTTPNGWDPSTMTAELTTPTEGMILVFPNNGVNGADSPRTFGLNNARTIGANVTFYLTYFQPTLEVNEKTIGFDIVNVNPDSISIQGINIFTSNYAGDITALTVKWSVVTVIDANGNIILTRDGANGKQIDVDHPNATSGLPVADAEWAVDNMMVGITIPEGGLVIVFPNDGTNGPDSPRTFGLNNMRTYGAQVTFHKFIYQPHITANSKTMNAVVNPVTPITTSAMIFDSNYSTAIDFSLGYGVLVVVDASGQIVKIHDGANAKYYDVDNPTGISATGYFTAGDYTNGVVIPTDGYVLIFPNDGTNGPDSPRTFGMGLRTIGLTVEVSLGL